MRRAVLLSSAVVVSVVIGALLARTALFVHVSTLPPQPATPLPDPKPQYSLARIAATAIALDRKHELLLVDTTDPYDATKRMRTQIEYSSSTEFVDPKTRAEVPFTDAIAETFAPGTPLYIWVDRSGGALVAARILE